MNAALGGLGTVIVNALPLALLGAVTGLDMVGFPQAMFSRPIVSATLAGTMLGRPVAGLLMGVVLELIALETLPFGASRYPEWGSAGVVGGAVLAAQPPGMPGALLVGVFAALATAMVSGWSMVALRQLAGAYARRMRERVEAGDARAVAAVQLRGLVMDLLRGGLVTFVSLVIFVQLAAIVVGVWSVDEVHSRAFVLCIAATIAAGAVWKIFHTTARAGWLFLVGVGLGGVVLLARGP